MVITGDGAIINTASVAGVIADPDMAPYVAAKHGVVAPGLVETGMIKAWKKDPKKWDEITSNNFLHRAASPEEIAGMMLFLASDLAGFSTGGVYTVDGGQTAH